MSQSTLTIRKNKSGKIISMRATGIYAKQLFNSLGPVDLKVEENESKEQAAPSDVQSN